MVWLAQGFSLLDFAVTPIIPDVFARSHQASAFRHDIVASGMLIIC